ncbi:hypothetical protein SNA_36190 [Streptomyces natalensis ATCC 27448]|uniref:Uncharacterized protein n=1 Tax=Streptomyces natalensis ATCC 27448 TaxID=1240678 RepID=A0A0D7CE44_9ACTN|nr:hypothetical protein [Streptomyces natalensis]KIZ14509.1 hypothetical protein SNA_36190 [Streptomyces natalensis ATCC 27448]
MPEHVPDLPFRLLFTDLGTDRLLDALPVKGLKFDDYIGKAGSLAGTIPIPDRSMSARVQQAIRPGRTAVWVERGRELWWGGIVWTLTPQVDDHGFVTADLQAATWDSALDHRIIYDRQTATNLDQLAIARQLVDYAQMQPAGDLGIVMDSAQTSGVRRNRKVGGDEVPKVREALDDLAKVDNGFEWRIRVSRSEAGARIKELQLGFPVIRTGQRPLMLTYPGNVLAYSWPQDATNVATVWQSRGATTNKNQARGTTPLLSERLEAAKELAAGWPRLDGSSDYNTVRDAKTLNEHARADLDAARQPVTIPTLRVRLDDQITPDLIGATVRLRIADTWHYEGLDASYRVVGWQATPAERGAGASLELYLEENVGQRAAGHNGSTQEGGAAA